jgi:hypothetical protein
MGFSGSKGLPQISELPVRRVERLRVVGVYVMRYPAVSIESLEGQEERIRVQVTAMFQLSGTYCCADEQRNIAFSQRRFPLDVEGGPGSSASIGQDRSLALLPEGVPRYFTWDARVQTLLNCLSSPQYPKFLSQFREHNANSHVM